MIKEERFIDAKPIDFFDDLTEEEKEEAEFMALIAMTIHDKRVSMNLNQEEFGKLNNVSQTMVSRWESGDYNFTISNLRKIFAALGIKIMLQDEKKQEPVHTAQTNNTATEWKTTSSGGASFAYRYAASPSAI